MAGGFPCIPPPLLLPPPGAALASPPPLPPPPMAVLVCALYSLVPMKTGLTPVPKRHGCSCCVVAAPICAIPTPRSPMSPKAGLIPSVRPIAALLIKGSCYGSTGRSDRNGLQGSRSSNKTTVGLWRAKSFSADLGGNKSNYSKFAAKQSRLQTKSSLRLDSRYNAAFIQVQTVLRKRYISRYVSLVGVLLYHHYYESSVSTSRPSVSL